MLRLHLFCFVFSFKYNNESITTVKWFRPWVLTQNSQDGPYHGEHEQIGWTVIYFYDSECFDPIWGRMQTCWVWNETDLNRNSILIAWLWLAVAPTGCRRRWRRGRLTRSPAIGCGSNWSRLWMDALRSPRQWSKLHRWGNRERKWAMREEEE